MILVRPVLLSVSLWWAAVSVADPSDWVQFDFDARRTGVNPLETRIHRGNVATLTMLWNVALPSIADGAPAYLESVATAGGVKDLLFVTTKAGHTVALDAASGSVVWSKPPAAGPNYTTSSPAIDPNRRFVYSYSLDGRVHKFAVGDGTETLTGGWPQLATLKPSVEKGSSALTIATAASGQTFLYATNGGYPGDAGDYQGHVTAIDLASGAQQVFNANCSDQAVHFVLGGSPDCVEVQTAIWARAGVTYDVSDDRIYMATGNGTFDATAGGHDWGDSVFSLHPDGTGASGRPLDSYTPTEYQQLQNTDADLGSTAPALLPLIPASRFPRMAVQSGKDAKVRLLNLADLSGQSAPGHIGGELQKIDLPQGGGVLTHPAVWTEPVSGDVWVYIANGSGTCGLQLVVSAAGDPALVPQWTQGPGGTSPVVANGILWVASSSNLRALDPLTGGTPLWSSGLIGGIHWESPIVVDGKVIQSDESGRLWAFAPAAAPEKFYTIPPCRIVDTRAPAGPLGGPSIGAGGTRIFDLAGSCLVPADALAVSANVTAIAGGSPGYLRVAAAGAAPSTSTVNFSAGKIRAGFSILSLTGFPVGSVGVTNGSAAPVDLVLDVTGYFR